MKVLNFILCIFFAQFSHILCGQQSLVARHIFIPKSAFKTFSLDLTIYHRSTECQLPCPHSYSTILLFLFFSTFYFCLSSSFFYIFQRHFKDGRVSQKKKCIKVKATSPRTTTTTAIRTKKKVNSKINKSKSNTFLLSGQPTKEFTPLGSDDNDGTRYGRRRKMFQFIFCPPIFSFRFSLFVNDHRIFYVNCSRPSAVKK